MNICHFQSLSKDKIPCSEDISFLKNSSYEDIVVILTETSILPPDFESVSYCICSSHFNNILKSNERKRNRLVCLIPSYLSAHPDIDHTEASELIRSNVSKRKKSRCLQLEDITTIFKKTGVVLAVGTPACINCRKEFSKKESEDVCTTKECPSKSKGTYISTKHVEDLNVQKPLETQEFQEEGKIKDTSFKCVDKLNGEKRKQLIESQEQTEDENTQETWQMEFDGSYIFTDSETIEQQSTQESQASYQREEALQYLNNFLDINGYKTVSSLPSKPWFELSKKSQTMYVDKIQNITECVIRCFFPENFSDVSQQVYMSNFTEKDTPKVKPRPLTTMSTIAEFYQKAESWQHRRQLLSMLSLFMTYQEALELIPDLTEYKYYASKKHGEKYGYGLPVPSVEIHRQKMDPLKLDSFLDFITSPHIIRDLPYGEKKLKLSDGTFQNVPNLIRCMGSSDITV